MILYVNGTLCIYLSILLRLLNPLKMMRKMINPTKCGRRNTRKRRRRIRREGPAPTQMMNGKRKLRTTWKSSRIVSGIVNPTWKQLEGKNIKNCFFYLLIWFDLIRFDSIRFDSIRFDSIRFGLIWFDLGRFAPSSILIINGGSICDHLLFVSYKTTTKSSQIFKYFFRVFFKLH